MEVIYKLDGIDLRDYNVFVAASDGLISRPKPKKNLTVDWADYNGTVVDLSKRLYEAREIELDCFIKAESQVDFVAKCNAFLALFDATGTRRLEVFVDNESTPKPLLFQVYLTSNIEVSKKWSATSMVGTFSLKLNEPEPIKKVLKYSRTAEINKTVSITVTSAKLLNIYWGDGSHTYDVSGVGQVITHDYAINGNFYILVTGNIDDITSLTSTGVLVWNKL